MITLLILCLFSMLYKTNFRSSGLGQLMEIVCVVAIGLTFLCEVISLFVNLALVIRNALKKKIKKVSVAPEEVFKKEKAKKAKEESKEAKQVEILKKRRASKMKIRANSINYKKR